MNLWSVALYYDAPVNLEKGTALSAYAGYFSLDYGTDYLRYNGIMNPANGINNGPYAGSQGNAFPMFGTGKVIYTQVGYLLKKDLLGDVGTLMPYASLMSADYDRLSDGMNVVDVGVNWLIKGHTSKLTLDYQNRPVYEAQGQDLIKVNKRPGSAAIPGLLLGSGSGLQPNAGRKSGIFVLALLQNFAMLDLKEIFSVTLILFSVIDILGSIPFIIIIRKREGTNTSRKGYFDLSCPDGVLSLSRSVDTQFIRTGCCVICSGWFDRDIYCGDGNDTRYHFN